MKPKKISVPLTDDIADIGVPGVAVGNDETIVKVDHNDASIDDLKYEMTFQLGPDLLIRMWKEKFFLPLVPGHHQGHFLTHYWHFWPKNEKKWRAHGWLGVHRAWCWLRRGWCRPSCPICSFLWQYPRRSLIDPHSFPVHYHLLPLKIRPWVRNRRKSSINDQSVFMMAAHSFDFSTAPFWRAMVCYLFTTQF